MGIDVLPLLSGYNVILTYIEFSTKCNLEMVEHIWEDVGGYVKIYEELGSPKTFGLLKELSMDVKEGKQKSNVKQSYVSTK